MNTILLRSAYENYRLQLMLNGVDRDGNLRVDSAYYYAVSERMFPCFHSHWCEEPDPFTEIYTIKKEFIEEVTTYIDDLLMKKQPIPSFYDLESKFGKRTRLELIRVFRYCFLSKRFDSEFYSALLAPTNYPIEAGVICSDLERMDYLIV